MRMFRPGRTHQVPLASTSRRKKSAVATDRSRRASATGKRPAVASIFDPLSHLEATPHMSNPKYERPLSPFMMYRWQYTNTLSILHRLTGCALSVGALLFVYWLVAAASGPEIVVFPLPGSPDTRTYILGILARRKIETRCKFAGLALAWIQASTLTPDNRHALGVGCKSRPAVTGTCRKPANARPPAGRGHRRASPPPPSPARRTVPPAPRLPPPVHLPPAAPRRGRRAHRRRRRRRRPPAAR